jgi:hypothetical protein
MFADLSQSLQSALVITDFAAYRCAVDLVDVEGDEAILLAADQADACLAAGDVDASSYWRRVESAIQILLLEDVLGTVH